MSIVGVKRLIYGVDDLDLSTRFFRDFGLDLATNAPDGRVFGLAEGSSIVLCRANDPTLPAPFLQGNGPREVIWGVDTAETLAAIKADLSTDRDVSEDAGGTLHTRDDCGIAIGFEVFQRLAPTYAPSAENTPGEIQRWNRHRQWFERAKPKLIFHVVFGVPDVDAGVAFYTKRLNFRVTDISRGLGMFMRCDGRNEHHNLFLMKSPTPIFSHVSCGVENIDELMAGANQMQRAGWMGGNGVGRHRASSLAFFYVKSPAGGQAEFSADGDYLTDEWQPRLWAPAYGNHHWVGQAKDDAGLPSPDVEILTGPVPKLADTVRART